jgi:hypothetical protein
MSAQVVVIDEDDEFRTIGPFDSIAIAAEWLMSFIEACHRDLGELSGSWFVLDNETCDYEPGSIWPQ